MRSVSRGTQVALVALLCGCSAPLSELTPWSVDSYANHQEALNELRDDVRALAGVTAMRAQYDFGGEVGSSASLSVRMARSATDRQVLTVIEAVHDGLVPEFGHDSAGASIARGQEVVVLHTQDSESQHDQVRRVVGAALSLKRGSERMEVEVDLRREIGATPRGMLRLVLPRGSTSSAVATRLSRLEEGPPPPSELDVVIVAADGSGIGGSAGLPREPELQLWRAVIDAGGGHAVVRIEPHYYHAMRERLTLVVDLRYPDDRRLHRAEIVRALSEQVSLVRAYADQVVLSATVNSEETVWLNTRRCPRGGGPIQRAVVREISGAGGCGL